jgi:predicted site-specific integrase-resolvase
LFETIEALANIEIYELYNLELSDAFSVPILTIGIAKTHLRPESAAQFCPVCLKDNVYHRSIWLPVASTICLEHKCLLVNSCLGCGRDISISNIIETHCSKCNANFAEVREVLVKEDSFGLFTQDTIQSWLLDGMSSISSSYSLPEQAPRVLFRLVDGLLYAAMQVGQEWPLLHKLSVVGDSLNLLPRTKPFMLSPYQAYNLYATAFKGIVDWPNGFHTFLNAYRNRERKNKDHNPNHDEINGSINEFSGLNELGSFYRNWIERFWKQPMFGFVQEAFNQYLIDNHILFPWIAYSNRYKDVTKSNKKFHFISVFEAMKLAGTKKYRLMKMIQSGKLITYSSKNATGITLVKREDVLELCRKWRYTLNLKQVANKLGLHKSVIPKLVQIGLLKAQHHEESYHWLFNQSDVSEFLECIVTMTADCSLIESKDKALNLGSTTNILSRVGLDVASTLLKIVEGKLHAYLPTDQNIQLKNLLFARTEVEEYLESIKAENEWVKPNEIAEMLKISKNSLWKWLSAGWISPVAIYGKVQYFNRKEVEEYLNDSIGYIEAVKILGVRKELVWNLARQGRIQTIKGPRLAQNVTYLFSRNSITEWRKNRFTHKEAAKMLDISTWELNYWVMRDKIRPIEDKEQKPWYFSLQTLDEVRTTQKQSIFPS